MARRKKDINDLNTFIPTRLINRFNKLQSDFNSFLGETGESYVKMYEDANSFEIVSSFELVNGEFLVNGEEFTPGGYFSTDEKGGICFDSDWFSEDLNYWVDCLHRSKRFWSMGCKEGATNVDSITGISLDGVIHPATCAALLDNSPFRTVIDDHTKVAPLQESDFYETHEINGGAAVVYNASLHCSTLLDARKLFVARYPELSKIVYLTDSVDLDGTFSGWHAFYEGEFWLTCVVVK